MERIAIETEEDFQNLQKVLESFGIEVLRPKTGSPDQHMDGTKLQPPPVMPRDYTAMIGNRFFIDRIPGVYDHYIDICDQILKQGNTIEHDKGVNTATVFPLGTNLHCSGPIADPWDRDIWNVVRKTSWPMEIPKEFLYNLPRAMRDHPKAIAYRNKVMADYQTNIIKIFPNYSITRYDIPAHIDGCFCPIKPGLVLSIAGIDELEHSFPDWEIIYQDNKKLSSRLEFAELKFKNNGKWWLPGENVSDDFIEFVETYLERWTGYIEETVFDVNILMIDEKNAVCTNFNDATLKAFDRHGVNPIKVNFRHRYFWDGGIHCITSDIHRIGAKVDLGLPIFP